MSERFQAEPPEPYEPPQTERSESPEPVLVRRYAPLPEWLERRLLQPGEEVTWVRGPRFCPWWERYVTNPLLFVVALALGGICVAVGHLNADTYPKLPVALDLVAGGIVFGSVVVLGFSAGCWTRLVVTNCRIVIIQGREVCRTWGLEDLPESLVRFGPRGKGKPSRTIDLEAVQTLFGSTSSDQFVDAKTIKAFGKQLDRIRARENDPTRQDRPTRED